MQTNSLHLLVLFFFFPCSFAKKEKFFPSFFFFSFLSFFHAFKLFLMGKQ